MTGIVNFGGGILLNNTQEQICLKWFNRVMYHSTLPVAAGRSALSLSKQFILLGSMTCKTVWLLLLFVVCIRASCLILHLIAVFCFVKLISSLPYFNASLHPFQKAKWNLALKWDYVIISYASKRCTYKTVFTFRIGFLRIPEFSVSWLVIPVYRLSFVLMYGFFGTSRVWTYGKGWRSSFYSMASVYAT